MIITKKYLITLHLYLSQKKNNMAHTLESYLVDLFPEATYVESGIDKGKWLTKHYEFNIKCNFYKSLETSKLEFVKPGDWKDTINRLKIKVNELGAIR